MIVFGYMCIYFDDIGWKGGRGRLFDGAVVGRDPVSPEMRVSCDGQGEQWNSGAVMAKLGNRTTHS